MQDSRTYLYVGNRSTVLTELIRRDSRISGVVATDGSWLAREVHNTSLAYRIVKSKSDALAAIEAINYDVLISVGFKYILPISYLLASKPNARHVNIHPSHLPDLRGADPIPGAILHGRDAGVSCHIMDDGIDTGPIVSRCRIPYSAEMGSRVLYQMCFSLESVVFQDAIRKDFFPMESGELVRGDEIYYTYKKEDSVYRVDEDNVQLLRRARAFDTPGKGLSFTVDSTACKAFGASHLGPIPLCLPAKPVHSQILYVTDKDLVVARYNEMMLLNDVVPAPCSEWIGGVVS